MKKKITVSVQVDQSIHDYIKTQAKQDGRSMSNWLLQLVLLKKNPQQELPFFGQPSDRENDYLALRGGQQS